MRYNSVHMSQNTLRLTRMRIVLTGDYSCALHYVMYIMNVVCLDPS